MSAAVASVGGTPLTEAQARRLAAFVKIYTERDFPREEAEKEAEAVWRRLYAEEGGAWVRREVAETSRGYSFAQRPEER